MARLTGASYAKITLAVVIALMLFAVAGLGSCAAWDFKFGKGSNDMIGNANVPSQGIENIEIDWAAGSVDVFVSDEASDEIKLVEYSSGTITKNSSMRWSASGNTLRIDYGGWLSCLSLGSKSLEVHVPQSLAANLGLLDIDGASGSYNVSDITCNTFRMHLASGRLSATGMVADQLDLDAASGTMNVQGRFGDSVRAHVASGKMEILCEEVCPRSVDADMASGNVSMSIPENDGFTAKVDKASGTFSSDFETSMQGGGLYVYKNGAASFDIDMASGSFTLRKLA